MGNLEVSQENSGRKSIGAFRMRLGKTLKEADSAPDWPQSGTRRIL